MINHRTWYENFLLSHPEEDGEREGRFCDIDCEQSWRYDKFLQVLSHVEFIPDEEAEKFYISRKGE